MAINNVIIKKLNVIPDERGYLQEIFRNDEEYLYSEHFGFGQIYMTTTYPGVVKGWHYHKHQTDRVVCLKGMIKLVIYDGKEIMEIFMGEQKPLLVTIPKGLYHGWKCVSEDTAYIVNIPDKVYDYKNPDEVRTHPHNNDIPYEWKSGREIDG